MRYAVRLSKDDNGTLLVTSRDFPEVTTFGENVGDALAHAREAIEEAIAARLATGREVPKAKGMGRHVVTLAPDVELKIRLNRIIAARGLTKSATARTLGLHRPQIDRLLDLRHETRSADLLEAFRKLGYSVNYRLSVAPVSGARGARHAA